MKHLWLLNRFYGQTVFIVGGGPSLKGFRFNLLAGRPLFCVTDSINYVPVGDAVWLERRSTLWGRDPWSDSNIVWLFYEQDVLQRVSEERRNAAHIITQHGGLADDLPNATLVHVRNQNERIVTPAEWTGAPTLYSRYQTGHMAINAALLSGASEIILLGFDQKFCRPDDAKAMLSEMTPHCYTEDGYDFFERIVGGEHDRDACHFYSTQFRGARVQGIHPEDGDEVRYHNAAGSYAVFKDSGVPIKTASPFSTMPFEKVKMSEVFK